MRLRQLPLHHLVPEWQALRGRYIIRQIGISEAENKKLIRIRYCWNVVGRQHEIVVVGDPQRVKAGVVSEPYVRTKCNSLDLRRNTISGDTVSDKHCFYIQEQSFGDGVHGCSGAVLVGDIVRVSQVDLKELL